MSGRPPTWLTRCSNSLILACALWTAASSVTLAQTCRGPLPSVIKADEEPTGVKFKLIAQQCDVLDQPATVRRAAQLDLYGSSAGVPIPGLPAVTAPVEALPSPPLPDATSCKRCEKVISLAPALTAVARDYGIDPLLLHALAHVESRHDTKAVSKAGALGAMQVMPNTARRFGVDDPERTLLNPQTNFRAAAAYLVTLRERYGENLRLMLAAYNAGEGAVKKYGGKVPPYPETQAYVRKVLSIYQRLTASFSVNASGDLVARGGRS